MTEPTNVPDDGVSVATEAVDVRTMAEKLTDAHARDCRRIRSRGGQTGVFVEDALSRTGAAETASTWSTRPSGGEPGAEERYA
jgi:hypothetical protein